MGDVIITGPDGEELRFTHEDFVKHGKPDMDGLQIPFSDRWETMTGTRQIDVSHATPEQTALQEERFGGHNAHYGDVYGTMQMFASTKEQRTDTYHEMVLPNGICLRIKHEWGEHGTVEGQVKTTTEKLGDGVVHEQTRRGFFSNLLGRRK